VLSEEETQSSAASDPARIKRRVKIEIRQDRRRGARCGKRKWQWRLDTTTMLICRCGITRISKASYSYFLNMLPKLQWRSIVFANCTGQSRFTRQSSRPQSCVLLGRPVMHLVSYVGQIQRVMPREHPFPLRNGIVLTPSVTFGCLATLPSWCPFVALVTGQTASSEASPTGG
jgi:hypothetical protein